MLKHLGIIVVILAMVATMGACKSSKANVQVFPVQVDGKTDAFNADFIAFFPKEVKAHAGDEIKFTEVFSGEPHSVTLGTDVNAFMGVVKQMCPTGFSDPACANEYPPAASAAQYNAANAKLPELISQELAVKQAAAQPCFLTTESAPADGSACTAEQQKQPKEFDGTQTFYNSGYLDKDGEVFSVKLSKDIAPGTYYYLCLLHREGMTGTITVVDKATAVPKPDEVRQAGQTALAEMVTKLQPAYDGLAALTADTAVAGASADDPNLEAGVNEFGPKEISIPVGGSVTWSGLDNPHTVSFNAPEDARPVLVKASDGSVNLNDKAIKPQNGPGYPQPGPNAPPPDPNAAPPLVDAGDWDGQGFLSSGIFLDKGSYKVTFTKAGTYTYICLVHPDMEGTVTVQ